MNLKALAGRGFRQGTLAAMLLMPAVPAFADGACRAGAGAIADAYVCSNCLYAMFVGDVESYVARNPQPFQANGDAIRCARLLSQALIAGGIRTYDPDALRRRDEVNTALGSMGIAPGPTPADPAVMLWSMGRQLSWLADVLPPAAAGNYGPLRTPVTEEQQMLSFACQLFRQFAGQDPSVRAVLVQQKPLVLQAVAAERRWLISLARSLEP